MNAWKEDEKADNITFVPDGNGEFTEGMGMLVGKEDLGSVNVMALFYAREKRRSRKNVR